MKILGLVVSIMALGSMFFYYYPDPETSDQSKIVHFGAGFFLMMFFISLLNRKLDFILALILLLVSTIGWELYERIRDDIDYFSSGEDFSNDVIFGFIGGVTFLLLFYIGRFLSKSNKRKKQRKKHYLEF